MRLVLEYSREDLDNLQYPIMVESWERVAGAGAGGKQRREYLLEFNSIERNTLQRYYRKFHRWYLVSGTPEKFVFRKLETIQLLKRAISFFAVAY